MEIRLDEEQKLVLKENLIDLLVMQHATWSKQYQDWEKSAHYASDLAIDFKYNIDDRIEPYKENLMFIIRMCGIELKEVSSDRIQCFLNSLEGNKYYLIDLDTLSQYSDDHSSHYTCLRDKESELYCIKELSCEEAQQYNKINPKR